MLEAPDFNKKGIGHDMLRFMVDPIGLYQETVAVAMVTATAQELTHTVLNRSTNFPRFLPEIKVERFDNTLTVLKDRTAAQIKSERLVLLDGDYRFGISPRIFEPSDIVIITFDGWRDGIQEIIACMKSGKRVAGYYSSINVSESRVIQSTQLPVFKVPSDDFIPMMAVSGLNTYEEADKFGGRLDTMRVNSMKFKYGHTSSFFGNRLRL